MVVGMTKWLMIITVLLFAFCVAGCATSDRIIRVGGGETAISGFITPVKETFEQENGISLSVTKSLSGHELLDLDKGAVDLVVSAHPLQELVEQAEVQNVRLDRASFRETAVGNSRMVIFLNRKNKLRKLSKVKLKGIFTGKIKNWRQVGGADRDIVVVWNDSPAAENKRFIEEVLDGAQVVQSSVSAKSYEEVRNQVMATPGSIGIAPQAYIASIVNVPKTPNVVTTITVVTKGEPLPRVKKLIELLKEVEYIP